MIVETLTFDPGMEEVTVSLSDRQTLEKTVVNLIDTVLPHLHRAVEPQGIHRISARMLSSNIRGVVEGALENDPIWNAMEVGRREEIIDWFFHTFRPQLLREVNGLTIIQLQRRLQPHIDYLRSHDFILPERQS